MESNVDLKFDDGKPRWDLVDLESLEGVAKVLEFGARKYEANSWQGIDSERYFAALMRHLTALRRGERLDSESGLRHIDHAMCNLMFLSWRDRQTEDVKFMNQFEESVGD